MATIARNTRSRSVGWSDTATTPSERLVASVPLPATVFAHLARQDRYGRLLVNNPWLTPEAFHSLYRKGIDRDLADGLLGWHLEPEDVNWVLAQANERRGDLLTKLLLGQTLTVEQQCAAARRLRTTDAAVRVLHSPAVSGQAKDVVLGKVPAITAVTFAANFTTSASDDTIMAWLSQVAPEGKPDGESAARLGSEALVAAVVRILRRRSTLTGALIGSDTLATMPTEVLAALACVAHGPDIDVVLDAAEISATGAALVADHLPGHPRAAKLSKSAARAPKGVYGHTAIPAQLEWLYGKISSPFTACTAWWALELGSNPNADTAKVASVLIERAGELAEWCGPDAVTTALASALSGADASTAGMLLEALSTVPPSCPAANGTLSALNRFDSPSRISVKERLSTTTQPGVLASEELLSSPVGGGGSWGAAPNDVGVVLADHLGDDPFHWEVLLGLCDSFVGTVRQMLAVTKASVA